MNPLYEYDRHASPPTQINCRCVPPMTAQQAKIEKLRARGWNRYAWGNGKVVMSLVIRAARKVNGKVEFYQKPFYMIINKDGLVIYSSSN